MEGWIHSPIGEQVDGLINPLFAPWTGDARGLICDGAAGTEADPDGGTAGLFFGDGGAGGTGGAGTDGVIAVRRG